MPNAVTIDLPQLDVRALVQPSTIDEENRTVELTASTGARVRRYNWRDGEYDEELSLKKSHVRMDRLKNGAPLLDSHWMYESRHVIGVVEEARIVNGEIVVKVRFAKDDEEADKVWNKVRQGILRKVSVGYRVFKFIDVQGEDDDVRVLRAVDWEPFEVSMVPIGADDGAGVRSEDQQNTNSCTIVLNSDEHREDRSMTENTNTAAGGGQGGQQRAPEAPPAASATPEPVDNSAEIRAAEQAAAEQAAADERQRSAAITTAVERVGLERSFADEMIEEGVDVQTANQRILDKLADADERSETTSGVRIVEDGDQLLRQGMQSAIEHRIDASAELHEAGRQFQPLTLLEMARTLLPASERVGNKMEIARRAMSTTDFPHLLANVGNKSLLREYNGEQLSFESFCSKGSMSDFKEVTRVRIGDYPDMKKLGEAGEITYGTMGEEKEAYALGSYARAIRFTRPMLINDDLQGFIRMMRGYGKSARRMKNDVVWGIITSNPVMGDGKTLFHADHGNLGTGVIAETGISAGRKAMRLQKSVDGHNLSIRPAHLLAPVALQTKAEKFLRPISATKTDDLNIFSSQFQLTTEPRLDDNSVTKWYLAADPGDVDTIEYAYLEGMGEEPLVESEYDFETKGLKVSAILDFAAKAIDWRGLYESSGV